MKKNGVIIKILGSTKVVVEMKVKKPSNFNIKGLRNLGTSLRDQGQQLRKINLKG